MWHQGILGLICFVFAVSLTGEDIMLLACVFIMQKKYNRVGRWMRDNEGGCSGYGVGWLW